MHNSGNNAEPPVSPGASVERVNISGWALTLTVPGRAAPGNPWLWIGEFPGELKALEDGLVARGWHVAYVKACDMFGSPRAMAVWEDVYRELHGRRGLSARPALLGISRGGLYVNAWTRLHPDRVSVLYLDNGLCDSRSWPGGFRLNAEGPGSAADWLLYKQEFGFASDDEALAGSVHPTDGFGPAVEAGVLLVSVHGTADTIVPYVDNAGKLLEFWQKSGGRSRAFAKEGGGHHPHGLPDLQPLIDILENELERK